MRERAKRPRAERTKPIRNWSTLFTPPGADETSEQPQSGRPMDAASLTDAVSRSVDLGYRVVDEYIRQGQKTAQRMSGGAYGPEAVTNDSQQLFARMAQYASEFMALWFEAAGLAGGGLLRNRGVATGDAPASAAGAPNRRYAAAEATSTVVPEKSPRTRVTIEVTSPYPTEVALDLRPEAMQSRLLVQALRSVDPDKPRIDDIAFQYAADAAENTPPSLRIRVSPDQPAGTYNALILDEPSSRPLGTVSVRISRP